MAGHKKLDLAAATCIRLGKPEWAMLRELVEETGRSQRAIMEIAISELHSAFKSGCTDHKRIVHFNRRVDNIESQQIDDPISKGQDQKHQEN
jgi:hypothetical protein